LFPGYRALPACGIARQRLQQPLRMVEHFRRSPALDTQRTSVDGKELVRAHDRRRRPAMDYHSALERAVWTMCRNRFCVVHRQLHHCLFILALCLANPMPQTLFGMLSVLHLIASKMSYPNEMELPKAVDSLRCKSPCYKFVRYIG